MYQSSIQQIHGIFDYYLPHEINNLLLHCRWNSQWILHSWGPSKFLWLNTCHSKDQISFNFFFQSQIYPTRLFRILKTSKVMLEPVSFSVQRECHSLGFFFSFLFFTEWKLHICLVAKMSRSSGLVILFSASISLCNALKFAVIFCGQK